MKFKLSVLAVALVSLAAQAQTPAAPSRPSTGTVAAPCIDLSAKPATTNPAAQRRGFLHRAGGVVGLYEGVDISADQNVCPLTGQQKAAVWARKSYSPGNLVVAGFKAAIWQATASRDHRGYGQGWDAYGARFGASLANTESTLFLQSFLLPTLLREDPRYFREARGSAGHRLGYAITRVVVARTDRGRQRFNFSEVLGALAAAGLSNTYYPQSDRNLSRTLNSAGLSLAASAGWNIAYEFGPDLLRKIAGKKKTTD